MKVWRIVAASLSLCCSFMHGMSDAGRTWVFVPSQEQLSLALPQLQEAQADPELRARMRFFVERLAQERARMASRSTSSSSSSSSSSLKREPEEEPSSKRRKTSLNDEQLLANRLTLTFSEFTDRELSRRYGLEDVGRLVIVPDESMPVNLENPQEFIHRIEQYFPNLISLSLTVIPLEDDGFAALAESSIAFQLQRLKVSGCGITSASFTTNNLNKFKSLKELTMAKAFDINNELFKKITLLANAKGIINGVVGNPEIGDEGFNALSESILAKQLTTLIISNAGITDKSFTAESLSNFSQLSTLYVSFNKLGDKGFEAIAKSVLSLQLEELAVSDCQITPRSFTRQNLNEFKKLKKLWIPDNKIEDVGFNALAESEVAKNLTYLTLRNCGITAESFTTNNLNQFIRLEVLTIAENPMGIEGINAYMKSRLVTRGFKSGFDIKMLKEMRAKRVSELLANRTEIPLAEFTEEQLSHKEGLDTIGGLVINPSPGAMPDFTVIMKLIEKYFPNLLSLTVTGVPIGDNGFKTLSESALANQLDMLIIRNCGIAGESFTIENLNKFKRLHMLVISGNSHIGDKGFKTLSESALANQLGALGIERCGITSQSFTVENLNKFKMLRTLNINSNLHIGNSGLKVLAESNIAVQLGTFSAENCAITAHGLTQDNLNQFRSLQNLNLSRNTIGDDGFAHLAQSHRAAQLETLYLVSCGITAQSFTIENLNKFTSLQGFGISGNALGADAFATLVHSSLCKTIQAFNAQQTGLPEDTLRVMKNYCYLKER